MAENGVRLNVFTHEDYPRKLGGKVRKYGDSI